MGTDDNIGKTGVIPESIGDPDPAAAPVGGFKQAPSVEMREPSQHLGFPGSGIYHFRMRGINGKGSERKGLQVPPDVHPACPAIRCLPDPPAGSTNVYRVGIGRMDGQGPRPPAAITPRRRCDPDPVRANTAPFAFIPVPGSGLFRLCDLPAHLLPVNGCRKRITGIGPLLIKPHEAFEDIPVLKVFRNPVKKGIPLANGFQRKKADQSNQNPEFCFHGRSVRCYCSDIGVSYFPGTYKFTKHKRQV